MQTEMSLSEALVELVKNASTTLPPDQMEALKAASLEEEEGSMPRMTLELMIKNAEAAAATSTPTCQDTGTLIFYIDHGPEYRQSFLKEVVIEAVREATRRTYLRPNAVDSLTGANSGDNTGQGSPSIHFAEKEEPGLDIRLMLKGGGSENMGRQYTLPDSELGAGRDIEGVRKCVIDAAFKAQGFGCAPGILGVGVGGDRIASFAASKESLFRRLDDKNENPEIDELEKKLLKEVNTLEVGPMGFGGKTTILGVKVSFRHRVPASFFVSVTYMCWANRKATLSYIGGKARFSQ